MSDQILTKLDLLRLLRLELGGELLNLRLGISSFFCQVPVVSLAETHELVEQLFLLSSLSLDLLLHILEKRNYFSDGVSACLCLTEANCAHTQDQEHHSRRHGFHWFNTG